MKIIFIVTTFVGLVYLVLQSDAGAQWLSKQSLEDAISSTQGAKINSHSDLSQQQFDEKLALQITEISQKNLLLQTENADLMARIETLEKHISDTALLNKKTAVVVEQTIDRPTYNDNKFAQSSAQLVEETAPDTDKVYAKPNDLDQSRLQQAKLQDVITRMEMASLNLLTR